jgi:hypothetical protein
MIIACPECSNPFEIADGHIAPLVQIECPTCSFRMILDFEAANDASLREDGMSIAQGFRDAASYRIAVAGGSTGASTRAAAEATQQPVVRQPPIEPPPERPPVRQPPVERAQPVVMPTTAPQPEPIVAPAPEKPPVRQPVAPTEVAQEFERPRSRPTLIAHTPPRAGVPVVATPVVEAQPVVEPQPVVVQPVVQAVVQPVVQPVAQHPPTFPNEDADADIDVSVDEFEPPPIQPLGPSSRTPQHTPSREPELSVPEMLQVEPEAIKTPEKPVDKQPRKRSPAVTAMMLTLLLVLLGAGGLMTWSLITTGDPFQKILELTGQAEPAPAPAAKPEAKKADGKPEAAAEKSDG